MSRYPANIITKSPATPTGPNPITGRAPGIWRLDDVAYWLKQGVWPDASADGYWPYVSLLLSTTSLGNANNNLFVDSSGAFNPVSRNGNTTQGSFSPYATNWSNYFDGSGDYLSIPNNAALNMSGSTFTLECWIYPNGDYSDYRTIMSKRNASTTSYQMFLFQTTGYLSFSRANTAYQSSATPTANAWNHVAAVYDGTNINLYLNGTRVLQTAVSIADTTDPLLIGAIYTGGENFNGYMSNVRVLKGVQAYSGATITVPTSPLTAISGTSLLTCQSNRFRDASSNNFTITVAGDTRVTDFGPATLAAPGITYNQSDITNWSGYFDGNGDYLETITTSAFTLSSGDWTVQGWYYSAPYTAANQVLCSIGVSGDNLVVATIGSNGYLYYILNNVVVISTTTAAPAGTWAYFALVKSGSTTTLYLNGVSIGTTTSVPNATSKKLRLGVAYDGTSPLNGYISNFRILSGTADTAVPTAPFTAIANTAILTCQNAAFTDNSTNNFVITQFGNVTVTGNSPFNTVGYWSNYFDGTGDYLYTPTNAAFGVGTGDFTVEAWIFPTGAWTSGGFNCLLQVDGTGIYFGQNSGGFGLRQSGTANIISYGTSPTLNTWTHVAIVRSGTTVTMYYNGTSVATATSSANFSAGNAWVGADAGPSNYYAGYISNLRLVKGTAVYTANFTVPTTPLTAITNTSLLTCQNGRFIDNSTNNFTITRNGDVSAQSFDPFYTATIASNGGSMYFDGSGDYLTMPSSPAFQVGTGQFTLECWIYFNTVTNINEFLWADASGTTGGRLVMYYSGGSLQIVASGGAGGTSASFTFVAGQWYHVAASRDASNNQRLFVNGALLATATSTNNYTQNGFAVARAASLNGYMAGIRLVKGTALYTAAFTPPTAPVNPTPATTLLLNGMNAGIFDATAINDMETVGNAQVSTVQSKYGGSSVYFDGSGDYLAAASSPNLSLASANFTLEMWMYHGTGAYVTSQPLLTQNWSTTWGTNFWSLHADHSSSTAGKFTFWVYNFNTGSSPMLISTSTSKTSTWNHIAIVRNGNSFTMYVNGVSEATATFSGSMDGGGSWPIYIGGPNQAYDGYIDDFRLTKGVARYTSNFTPPTQAFPTY